MDENKSEDEMSDSEILKSCERELSDLIQNSSSGVSLNNDSEKSAEKRKQRDEDNDDEEGLSTVIKRKPKRLLRSFSTTLENNNIPPSEENISSDNSVLYEVCITSLENLPKQIAMAQLLQSENIKEINRIKYKGPNRIFVQFKTREDAMKLVESDKFKELGYRCQMINELSMSFGVVKGVDLDISEENLVQIFQSSTEIISIKRLKRFDENGKWVNSESIRICFKGNLPRKEYAYDCCFKVEPLIFPVT